MAKGIKTGGGSRKGIPNKSTQKAQEAIAVFVENNTPKFEKWLDEIYKKDGPRAAFDCVKDLIEYHVPKLSRAQVDVDATVRNISDQLANFDDPE